MGTSTQPDMDYLVRLFRAEYEEMPGLMLTTAQAAKLWSLDVHTCAQVLARLQRAGYLSTTRSGAFRRASVA